RLLLRGRRVAPLRISPKVRTLKWRESSNWPSTQVLTRSSGVLVRLYSEITFVSSRKPLIARPGVRDLYRAPNPAQSRRGEIPSGIGRGSSYAWPVHFQPV